MNFDVAFEKLIGHEGGHVNDKNDPGGETKFGISKRSYPHLHIASLKLDDAKAIYRRDYWDAARCDSLPSAVSFDLFDGAVNSGVPQAVKWLQAAVGVPIDGKVGPVTIAACRGVSPSVVTSRYNGHRLAFMTERTNWPAHGKGWARRIATNLMGA